ncbi:hypothetical protein HBN99_17990 [Pseudomonas oryzihabitans]|uniref:hypothetical protein n=1 Tax=Pseudomonas oryzihabitans TaxID=47885 RepID=UPI001474811D|nr:hypothetical protein [Pseudomonas oryzihabitans]NMZ66219.1 hypothetical protein [Pseudomonas oryzihabitans]
MNHSTHPFRLALATVHRLEVQRPSRLLALLGRLFCHERSGAVLCASPGAAVFYRPH